MSQEIIQPLKRPLTFGDVDQINALRQAERQAEWDAIADCKECGGVGECKGECRKCRNQCEFSCPACQYGKDAKHAEKFFDKYPNFTPK